MSKALLKRQFDLLASAILAAVFISSGVAKVLSALQFADSIASYRIISNSAVNLVAMSLPSLEIASGLLVFTVIYARVGMLIICLLLAVFVLALINAMMRGLTIDCGCFGELSWMEANPAVALTRDLVLLCLGVYLYITFLIQRSRTS